jgi:ABC-type transporter Mla MlaB component
MECEKEPRRQTMSQGVFGITIHSLDGTLTVTVAGELEHRTGLLGPDRRHPTGETKVVVDLSDLTFIDVTGLRALATARNRLSARTEGRVRRSARRISVGSMPLKIGQQGVSTSTQTFPA